jgi:hypothetical protein
MLLEHTAIDSMDFVAGPAGPAVQSSAHARRRQLIAERARARRQTREPGSAQVHVPAGDHARVILVERQLRIEIEARIEQLRMALRLQQLEATPPHECSASMLLAAMLSARQLLDRYGRRTCTAGGEVSDALYYLECQVDALYLAAAQLCPAS